MTSAAYYTNHITVLALFIVLDVPDLLFDQVIIRIL